MALKLDAERLYKNLDSLPRPVSKTVQLLKDQDPEWFKQISVEYLMLCPPGSVDISDLEGDDDDGSSASRIMADKAWCDVERELVLLAKTADRLSGLLLNLSSSSTLLFQEAIKKMEALEASPLMGEAADVEEIAAINAISALGYVFLPFYDPKMLLEQSIDIIDGQVVWLPSTPTETHVPPSHGRTPRLHPNMNSERATELIMFERLCQALAKIACRRKGSNLGNPMSEGERSRWLIFKVADKLASIQNTTKQRSPDHAVDIAQTIMNSLRDLDSQVVYSRSEGERAIRAWRAEKKTQP